MADFAGYVLGPIESAISPTRPAWQSAPIPFINTPSGYLFDEALYGSAVNNLPIAKNPTNYAGYLEGVYNDIFYERILVEPMSFDLGNVTTQQTRDFIVWNGFFSLQTMQDISGSSTGISIVGVTPPPNVPFGALEEKSYQLAIAPIGPASIDVTYTFDFIAVTDATLQVTGTRVVTFPYWFAAPSTERIDYLTEVITTHDGTEQRIRLRSNPRQSFVTTAYLQANEVNKALQLLYSGRTQIWAMPVWSEARAGNPVSENDTTITVDTQFGDFRIGGLAMIRESTTKFDVIEIQSFDATSITFSRGINDDYAVPNVIPVRSARFISDPTRFTNGMDGNLSLSFEVIDNQEVPELVPQQFENIDVFLEEQLLNPTQIAEVYTHGIELIDFQSGLTTQFVDWTRPKPVRTFQLAFLDPEESWNFKRFLARRGGRQRPFLMPTGEANLRLLSTGFLTTPILVEPDELVGKADTRRRIAVRDKTGNWTFHIANTYTEDPSGATSVSFANPLNINASDVDIISFMPTYRLTNDQAEIRWQPNCVGTAVLSITEIAP